MLTTFLSAPLTSLLTSTGAGAGAGAAFLGAGAAFLGGGLGGGLGAAFGAGFFAGAAFFFVAAAASAAMKAVDTKSESLARAEGVRLRPGELALSASMLGGGGVRNLTDLAGGPFFSGFFWIVFFGDGAGLAGAAFLEGTTLTGVGFGGGAFLAAAFFGGGAGFFRADFLGGGGGGARFLGAERVICAPSSRRREVNGLDSVTSPSRTSH